MNLFALVASFEEGIIGAYMGTLSTFTLTGVIAIIGSVVAMAGGADMAVGFIAFDSYPGPHIAFTNDMAASVYADRTKRLGGGTDILSCLNGLADPATLLVGGIFGVIGFLIHYLIGTILHLNTDLPGFTAISSAVITRLVFGSSSLIGKAAPGESREYFTSDKGMLCNVILGLGLGTTAGFMYQALPGGRASVVIINSYPILCFGITAVSLILVQTGFAMPATYHITLISALAAASSQSPVTGIVFGILTALSGDFVGKTSNSCCNTHIDPPVFTIFVFTSIVNIIFGSGFFSI